MKVLHINFEDCGGAAEASKNLHEELIRQGIDSSYVCINLRKHHREDLNYFSHRRCYTSYLKKIRYLYFNSWKINYLNFRLLKKSKGVINEFVSLPYSQFDLTIDPLFKEADIVHLHWTSRTINWSNFFRKNQKTLIWSLHDQNPFSGILHCKTEFPESLLKLENKIKRKKANWIKKSNVHVVAPSTKIKNDSLNSFVLKRFTHSTIFHGVSDKIFFPIPKKEARIKLNISSKKKIILSVATDTKRKLKGFEELYDYAKDNKEFYFIFIGDHCNTESPSNIFFAGNVLSNEKLNLFYNSADIFISNSREESFGLTVAEALMTGTFVLARNTGVASEILDGQIGAIFDEMNQITLSLNHNYSKEHIRSRAQTLFDIENQTHKYIKLYSNLINTKR